MRGMLMALALVGACGGGTTRVVQYAPPIPRGHGPLPVIRLDDVSTPFRRSVADVVDHDVLRDKPKPAGVQEKDPHLIVREANSDAYTEPAEGEAEGHTQVYVYDPDREYPVYACAMQNVMIRMAPGERLTAEPLIGNLGSKKHPLWMHVRQQSGDGHGHMIEVLLIRPSRDDLERQRMHLLTNVGPYTLELNVLPTDETSCMRAVRWRHPERELQRLIAEDEARTDEKQRSSFGANGCTSMNYEIEVVRGSPRWVPTGVVRTCDGGHAKVNIQFASDVTFTGSKIPGFMCDGGVCDYRFVPEDHVMVVDGVFTRGLLKLGSKETGYEMVAIRALKEPSR